MLRCVLEDLLPPERQELPVVNQRPSAAPDRCDVCGTPWLPVRFYDLKTKAAIKVDAVSVDTKQ